MQTHIWWDVTSSEVVSKVLSEGRGNGNVSLTNKLRSNSSHHIVSWHLSRMPDKYVDFFNGGVFSKHIESEPHKSYNKTQLVYPRQPSRSDLGTKKIS